MADSVSQEMECITVLGAGTMGHGIAQVFATEGYDVTLVDIDATVLEKAVEAIKTSLRRLDVDPDPVLDRLTTTTDRTAGLRGADLMVEAVPEDLDLKKEQFAAAEDVLEETAVLATNTSSIPISEIAAATDRPERLVGMHFSNPVPVMPILEIVSGERTSQQVLRDVEAIGRDIGKTPIRVRKDVPGFVLNRINYAFWNEALRPLDEGSYDRRTIDAAVQRLRFPMGPFEVLDFAGIDVFYSVCQAMQDRGVPGRLSETLEELVSSECYGMKSGAGFYEYSSPGSYERVEIPFDRRYEFDPYPMIASAANAAAWLVEQDVATRDDIDRAMEIGMNWPRGPLKFADEFGIDRVVAVLDDLHRQTGSNLYRPTAALQEMVASDQLGAKTGEGFYEHAYEATRIRGVRYDRRDWRAVIETTAPEDQPDGIESIWDGLKAALQRAEDDPAVRATIVAISGDTDLSQAQFDAMRSWTSVDDGTQYFESAVRPAIDALRAHPKPVIGVAAGEIGDPSCGLLLASDIALAPTGETVRLRAAAAGTLPYSWLTDGLDGIRRNKARELAVSGGPVSTSEAVSMGLLNYAVPSGQERDVARELTRSTLANAPDAVAKAKALCDAHADGERRSVDLSRSIAERVMAADGDAA